jgi:hypothetical protein
MYRGGHEMFKSIGVTSQTKRLDLPEPLDSMEKEIISWEWHALRDGLEPGGD